MTWIVVILIIVILVVLGPAFYFGRKRRFASHRTQAAELRQAAQDDDLTAREVGAKTARTAADVKQSEVDAANWMASRCACPCPSAASSIFDAGLLRIIGKQVKLSSWYDNEWGFSNRLVDLTEYVAERL